MLFCHVIFYLKREKSLQNGKVLIAKPFRNTNCLLKILPVSVLCQQRRNIVRLHYTGSVLHQCSCSNNSIIWQVILLNLGNLRPQN